MARPRRTATRRAITPLWECAVFFVFGLTMADALRAARRRWRGFASDVPGAAGDALDGCAAELPDGSGVAVLLPVDAAPGTVAHECAHAATRVLRRAGVRVCAADDEPLAYTLGHLVDAATPWLAQARATLGPAPAACE